MQGDKLIEMLLSGLTAKPKDVLWDASGGKSQVYRALTHPNVRCIREIMYSM